MSSLPCPPLTLLKDDFNTDHLARLPLLGRGASSECRLYRDPLTKEPYAIKVLLKPSQPTEVPIFNHVYGAGSAYYQRLPSAEPGKDATTLIVMKYLGKPLLSHRDMSFSQKILIFRLLLVAIQELHELGVLHLDIKPENILIRDGQPYLTDFGNSLFADYPLNKLFLKKLTTEWYKPPLQGIFKEQFHSERTDYFGAAMSFIQWLDFPVARYASEVFGLLKPCETRTILKREKEIEKVTKRSTVYMKNMISEPTLRHHLRSTYGKSFDSLQGKNAETFFQSVDALQNHFKLFLRPRLTTCFAPYSDLIQKSMPLFIDMMMDFLAVYPTELVIPKDHLLAYQAFLYDLYLVIASPKPPSSEASPKSAHSVEEAKEDAKSEVSDGLIHPPLKGPPTVFRCLKFSPGTDDEPSPAAGAGAGGASSRPFYEHGSMTSGKGNQTPFAFIPREGLDV